MGAHLRNQLLSWFTEDLVLTIAISSLPFQTVLESF